MATLAFAAAGAAVGSALLPAGISALGVTLSGAAIGSQVGALAGAFVDQSLFGASGRTRQANGPRLQSLRVTSSTEGAPVPRLYGRARLGGQVIWATDFDEEAVTQNTGSGSGKGTASSTTSSSGVEYRYDANVAIALCEGVVTGVHRIWADGVEIDRGSITWRLHTGADDQQPDSLVLARQGDVGTPAYRGVAYIVFERLPLAPYGNRLPQFSFEVERAIDSLADTVRAVVMIPGAGEFALDPVEVTRRGPDGSQIPDNTHTRQGGSDWTVALDQLEAALPAARRVSLVVSWFGTDLRAGHCRIEPRVEDHVRETSPAEWRVAGLERTAARQVTRRNDRPAYGGTPSDASVIRALRDLAARGIAATLTPFILMDIPADNALADPGSSAASQPSYPWRGRVTVSPAPGRTGTVDHTADAANQIAAFVGTAQASDFSLDGDTIAYTGPDEWSYRRHILHYAHLAKASGTVDTFVIGSELRGLTSVRDASGTYPFVAALIALAADVSAILGPAVKITYAADWSEWFGHQPPETPGAFVFNLDPLWSSPDIDAIGIDLYWPLADWRAGTRHLDWRAGWRSIHDPAYLAANVQGGEGYDWYYASDADRLAQARTPITDGRGKPWMWRVKDIASWWSNAHHDRPDAHERATPTAWVPQSKPVWFMELGAPAIDKAANQPNVFVDEKSAESALPYFSDGRRDDLLQRRTIEAILTAFAPVADGGRPGANPVSAITGAPMVDLARAHVYCWDARPSPAFPADAATWGDADNWRRGHWISGRVGNVPLSSLVAAILDDVGVTAHDTAALVGTVPGYVIDRVMSARDALQAIELAFFCDAIESEGRLRFMPRAAASDPILLDADALVETKPGADLAVLTRAQDRDLPASAKITYIEPSADYAQAVAEARRLAGMSGRVAQAEVPIVLDADQATAAAESWLFESWAARERVSFTLPPSLLAVEPGDVLALSLDGRERLLRVTSVSEHGARDVEALSVDPSVYEATPALGRVGRTSAQRASGPPQALFLDLPLLRGDEPEAAGYIAVAQSPWPGSVAILRSPEDTGFARVASADASATVGVLLDPLPPGPIAVFDRATRLRVRLSGDALASVGEAQLFAGANVAAVRAVSGEWEVLQFLTATLVAPSTYELSGLLRAQAGTDIAMAAGAPTGSRFVRIDGKVARVDLVRSEIGLPLRWMVGPAAQPIGGPRAVTTTHAFAGVGLRPLSPAHVRGARASSGDLVLSWVRRTRIGGDTWDVEDVPLGETSESYEVRILAGASVARVLAATEPTVIYTAAQQAADFGIVPTSLTVEIRQRGALGLGSPARATV